MFWRILLFYIGSIFVVGTVIAYTDPNLLHGDESHIAFSPFTMVFQQLPRFGYYAANLMNAVILSSVLSCGNSSMYVASRMLYAMAHSHKAPKMFGTLNRRGVPVAALWATGLVSALAFFSTAVGDQKICRFSTMPSSLSGFLIWLGIAVCHLRFRQAWVAQGRSLDDLKFKAKFFPYGPWIALILFVTVLFGANIRRLPDAGVLLVRLHHRLSDDSRRRLAVPGPQAAQQDPPGAPEGLQFRDGITENDQRPHRLGAPGTTRR